MTKSRGIRRPKGQRDAWAAANAGLHVCQCGCGGVIPVRPEHIHKGVPQYLHGHNARGRRKPLPPRMLCECGCGALAGPGKRFVSGHNGRGRTLSPENKAKLLAANHRKKGKPTGPRKSRVKMGLGYVGVQVRGHPHGNDRHYVLEHRLVMERHLRESDPESPYLVLIDGERYLSRDAEVHHVNEVKTDNRLENLEVMTKAEHARLHRGWEKMNEAKAAKRAATR